MANPDESQGVGVCLPWHTSEDDFKYANVFARFHNRKDDVVLLKLAEEVSLKSHNIAKIAAAKNSASHKFRSYGYRILSNQDVPSEKEQANTRSIVTGYITGSIGIESSSSDCIPLLQLNATEGLMPGCSGGAVFDEILMRVVGIISFRYDPMLEDPSEILTKADLSASNDTKSIAWAVDSYVLTLPPMNLKEHSEIQIILEWWENSVIHNGWVKLKNVLKQIMQNVRLLTKNSLYTGYYKQLLKQNISLNGAPEVQDEWVKRQKLLEELDLYWLEQKYSVIELVGSGGQGKSTLARQWLDSLLSSSQKSYPSVFWWSFYSGNTEENVDLFFQELLEFVCGDRKSKKLFSQVEVLSKLKSVLKKGKQWLLILDGLEEVQNLDGSLQRNGIKELLSYFANGRHNVFCLITSRLYVRDLIGFNKFTKLEVNSLNDNEGIEMLRKLGVKGDGNILNSLITGWKDSVIALKLLGNFVVRFHAGDFSAIQGLFFPLDREEDTYKKISRILRRFDEQLTDADRAFLMLFSAFQISVKPASLRNDFTKQGDSHSDNLIKIVKALSDDEFQTMLQKLHDLSIIQSEVENIVNPEIGYSMHPLIRSHYLNELNDRIDYRENFLWVNQTTLLELKDQFSNKDFSQEPINSDPQIKYELLELVGYCYLILGDLDQAVGFYKRSKDTIFRLEKFWEASKSCIDLANLYLLQGKLSDALKVVDDARLYAGYTENKPSLKKSRSSSGRTEDNNEGKSDALACQAYIYSLQGNIKLAEDTFNEARDLWQANELSNKFLLGRRGIQYTEFLYRKEDYENAKKIANLILDFYDTSSDRKIHIDKISFCHFILGNIFAIEDKHHLLAEDHYHRAVNSDKQHQSLNTQISALLARGRWLAKYIRNTDAASADLNEAFKLNDSRYPILEIDTHIAFAWTDFRLKKYKSACQKAEIAKQTSQEIGYHWGQRDAEAVFREIGDM
jgi:hypothetical protein